MEARGGNLRDESQMAAAERLNLILGDLMKIKEDHYSLTVSLQLTQNELERVKKEAIEKDVLIESLRETAKARKRGGGGKKRELRGVTKRRRNDIRVQECFYGFAQAVYERVLDYAEPEISALCFD